MTYASLCFDALGDPTRRQVFEMIALKASSVSELANRLPVSRPAVSQHLKVLRDAGLVVSQPVQTRNVYSVNREGVEAMRSYIERLWTDALAAFAQQFEDPGDSA